jgi:hypothetical protein
MLGKIGKRPGGITFSRLVLPRREKQRKYKVARHQISEFDIAFLPATPPEFHL